MPMLHLFFKKNKEQIISEWEKKGKPSPPPHSIKQDIITEYKNKFGVHILVETGTYLGEMIEAQKNNFSKIYSIELSDRLYRKAKRKFKKEENIFLLHGDSGKRLVEIIAELYEPALFWLDGHYSGGITALGEKECPVREELQSIFISKFNHIVLIDDARLFNGTHDYPTIEEIKNIAEQYGKKYNTEVIHDIICLTPQN
jgi:hypothetical protein